MANKKQMARAAAEAAQKAEQEKRRRLRLVSTGIVLVVLVLVLGGIAILGGSKDQKPAVPTAEAPENLLTGKHYVQIDVKDYGVITAELDADNAPITVTNFMNLAESGFYDGLTFHRIIDGFMIQGGDPRGNGTGGSGTQIKGEFMINGVGNELMHERGALSMARSQHYDSASSQFFIVHQRAAHLDGAYAVFGHVLEGMEIVDAICANTPVTDGNGTVLKANQPVITSVRRIEKPADNKE